MKLDLLIRDYDLKIDSDFVYNTYLKSQRKYWMNVPQNVYYKEQANILRLILLKHRTKIACSSEKPDQIFGWAAADITKSTLHFAYVKQDFRGLGIFTKLMQEFFKPREVVLVSHNGDHLDKIKGFNLIYYPYALMSI